MAIGYLEKIYRSDLKQIYSIKHLFVLKIFMDVVLYCGSNGSTAEKKMQNWSFRHF